VRIEIPLVSCQESHIWRQTATVHVEFFPTALSGGNTNSQPVDNVPLIQLGQWHPQYPLAQIPRRHIQENTDCLLWDLALW